MGDQATQDSLRLWESIAPAWERYRSQLNAMELPATERMFEFVGAGPGDKILELTAGSGGAGLMLAARVPGAKFLLSDFSPNMVQAIERGRADLGLTNVEALRIDAQEIDLPDASVDGVMSRHGLMLVPDYRKAFSEIRRVLKPGRSLAYVVWSPVVENPWMMLVGATLMQRGHFTPPPGGGFFPLTTEEENRDVTKGAGFDDVTVETIKTPFTYESFDAYWDMSSQISGPLVEIIARLPDHERTTVRDTIDQYSESFRTPSGGLEFPASRIVVRAR